MTDETKKLDAISHFEGDAAVDYGPTDETKLSLTAISSDGARHNLVFQIQALRQLSKLVKDIEVKFPGALRGH